MCIRDRDQPLRNIMTPQERLVTMKEGATLDEAQALMHKHRLERVLIVNDGFELRGLATVKDIVKNTEHPLASKDAQGQLRVGAAVSYTHLDVYKRQIKASAVSATQASSTPGVLVTWTWRACAAARSMVS